MKYTLLSLFAVGSIFGKPSTDMSERSLPTTDTQESTVKEHGQYDPTRNVFFVSVDRGGLFYGQPVAITTNDVSVGWRSGIWTLGKDVIGDAHKISYNYNSIDQYRYTPEEYREEDATRLPNDYSYGYQNLIYLFPKNDYSLYFGGGIFAHTMHYQIHPVNKMGPTVKGQHTYKAINYALGLEMNRKGAIPVFIEVNLDKIRYQNPIFLDNKDHQDEPWETVWRPKIKIGMCY